LGVWTIFEKSTFALTPNPSPKLGNGVFIPGFPRNKKTTRQRGAGTAGDGGVRARELCLDKGAKLLKMTFQTAS
jgi:hypothetical protein